MPSRLTSIGVFLLGLLPSAYLAWTLRAMPHLGFYHDDSIYWVSARSLALGDGYRIQSLPSQPFQTKYPPLYPALLAAIWKINPQFPSNLPLATLFSWLMLPPFLIALWILLGDYGFTGRTRYLLLLMAALSPVTAVFTFSLMPELLFTALLVASLILAERAGARGNSVRLALVAGIFAALAYLTKSAAAPLLLTVPFCFLLRRQFRNAALFAVPVLPAVAAWQWWAARHMSHSWDLVTLYYTNYFGFRSYNISLRDLPLVAWYNLDTFLQGAGKLLVFDMPYGSKHLERLLAVAAIAGCVRLTLRKRLWQYPVAALAISALLLVWHYPPDQRFVFPLFPLLLMGLATEAQNIFRVLRVAWSKPSRSDRFAAAAIGTALAALAAFALFCTVFGLSYFLPDLFASYRTDFISREKAYEWIDRNVPPGANLYAYDDPVVYLFTGRRACHLFIPPKFLYHDDDQAITRLMASMADFARGQQLQYLLLTPDDYFRDWDGKAAPGLRQAMGSGAFQKLYDTPRAAIYELNPAPAFSTITASVASPDPH